MVAQKRLPVTTGVKPPGFEIRDWPKFRSIFGREKLPDELKSKIEDATRKYLWLTDMESAAAPLVDATAALDELSHHAEALHRKMRLLTRHQGIAQAAQDVNHLILHKLRHRLRVPTARPLADQIEPLIGALQSLEHGLKQAKVELDSQDKDFQREGQAWDGWICKLSGILKNAELPTGVSKDVGKQSRFAQFVCELGQEVKSQSPKYDGRETSLEGPALAQAIHRARKRGSRP